jgi:hypothetical protein
MFYKDYQADCQIINKLMVINAGLSQNPEVIKQAGISDELGGAAQRLQQAVSDRIEKDGVLAALLTYMSPVWLSKIWWPLGILPLIAGPLGIDVGGFLNSIIEQVKSIISSTGDFTQDDASRIADQSTSSLIKGASLDYLRELEKQGELVNSMQGKNITFTKEAQFGRRRSSNPLRNIINQLSGRPGGVGTVKKLFGGLLRWFIMPILLGIAAFEGPKVLFGDSSEPAKQEAKPEGEISFPGIPQFLTNMSVPKPPAAQAPRYDLPQPVAHNLKSSGKGNQYHINSSGTIWLMDNLGSVENTLVKWAINIYPELAGHEQDILNNASFNKIASIIYQVNPQGISQFFKMPPDSGLHTMKDIVDRFVGTIKVSNE